MSTQKLPLQQSPTPQQISSLPQPYKSLWITNKRLQKQIDILNLQLKQKTQIIKQLKLQIDSTILQDTKNRLQIIRSVQQQVNTKIQQFQTKQSYLQKLHSLEIQLQNKVKRILEVQKQLQIQKQQNMKINVKMNQFKEHVIAILGFQSEKQVIIQELTKIVNFQEMENKVQKIKKQTLQRYGINQQAKRQQYSKAFKLPRNSIEQKYQSKEKPNKFQTSKVQIKRNV